MEAECFLEWKEGAKSLVEGRALLEEAEAFMSMQDAAGQETPTLPLLLACSQSALLL